LKLLETLHQQTRADQKDKRDSYLRNDKYAASAISARAIGRPLACAFQFVNEIDFGRLYCRSQAEDQSC
jgi:hypothetical protein